MLSTDGLKSNLKFPSEVESTFALQSESLKTNLETFEKRILASMADMEGRVANSINASSNAIQLFISEFEGRHNQAVGRVSNEVNLSLNTSLAQQSRLEGLTGTLSLLEKNMADMEGRVASSINASSNATQLFISEFEKRHNQAVGRVSNEVNLSLNTSLTQQSRLEGLTGTLSLLEKNMADMEGRVASSINASSNAIQLFISGFEERHNQAVGRVSNEVNLSLNTSLTQQSRLEGLTGTLSLLEKNMADMEGRVASSINASSNAIQLFISGFEERHNQAVGRVSNEVNLSLNTSLIQQSRLEVLTGTLNLLEKKLVDLDDSSNRLNSLTYRSLAALLARNEYGSVTSRQSTHEAKVMPPTQVPRINEQMNLMRQLAPKNFQTWKNAYQLGVSAGEQQVEGNLSHDGHLGANLFRMFVNIHGKGRLLDIGCGPLGVPSYLVDWPQDQLAGIDPQNPFTQHPFSFSQSFAEFLGWPDESFDTVVIGTSLDHVYLLDVALSEIKRVLTKDGRLLIWTAMMNDTTPYDPYGSKIQPPDQYHLFHPGKNWFYKLFEKDYILIEKMSTVASSEMLAFQLH